VSFNFRQQQTFRISELPDQFGQLQMSLSLGPQANAQDEKPIYRGGFDDPLDDQSGKVKS
jgi:hypothetical protein